MLEDIFSMSLLPDEPHFAGVAHLLVLLPKKLHNDLPYNGATQECFIEVLRVG
ncbi:hypothetical protein [Segetibacter sp.]|jgi:hypothetical protein|uniref:hypothetical protein n=1 Tax=Segetibacter sp. TaxID=2231182 RepID=UPI0026231EE6|nr:hypothetical protein [Segetibacter sp.]